MTIEDHIRSIVKEELAKLQPSLSPAPVAQPSQVLTVKQVAKELAVSVETVRAMIHRGELEHVKVGKRLRVQRHELDAYLKRDDEETADVIAMKVLSRG